MDSEECLIKIAENLFGGLEMFNFNLKSNLLTSTIKLLIEYTD